jgi:hypothetical protein
MHYSIVGGEGWQEKVENRGMEKAAENGKELSHSARATSCYVCLMVVLDRHTLIVLLAMVS